MFKGGLRFGGGGCISYRGEIERNGGAVFQRYFEGGTGRELQSRQRIGRQPILAGGERAGGYFYPLFGETAIHQDFGAPGSHTFQISAHLRRQLKGFALAAGIDKEHLDREGIGCSGAAGALLGCTEEKGDGGLGGPGEAYPEEHGTKRTY